MSGGLVRVLFPLDESNWTQYAHVLATIDDRQAWVEVAAVYAAFSTVAANDQTAPAGFAPTLAQQAADAVEALRPHV